MKKPEWKLYRTSEEAWNAMLEACRKAKTSIDMEQYIIGNDSISKEFTTLLAHKAQQGVRVRLLCDASGSFDLYKSPTPKTLRESGVEVRFFNIIQPWRLHNFFSWFFRDHRKILVVDNTTAITGGVGIRDDMRHWRDTTIQTSHKEMVTEIQHSFEVLWNRSKERHIVSRIKRSRTFKKGQYFITSAPYFNKRFFYHELLNTIRKAQESVFLTTPYFIPDHKLMKTLIQTAERGVRVSVLLPAIVDTAIVGRCSHAFYEKLLRHGVKIFHYTGNFLHAKAGVIDSNWATVGSFNLDSLSFFYNYEANIVYTDPLFVTEMKALFLKDVDNSIEITLEKWKERGWFAKWNESFALLFRRIL